MLNLSLRMRKFFGLAIGVKNWKLSIAHPAGQPLASWSAAVPVSPGGLPSGLKPDERLCRYSVQGVLSGHQEYTDSASSA